MTSPPQLVGNVGFLFPIVSPSLRWSGNLVKRAGITGVSACTNLTEAGIHKTTSGDPLLGSVLLVQYTAECNDQLLYAYLDEVRPAVVILIDAGDFTSFTGAFPIENVPPSFINVCNWDISNKTPAIGITRKEGALLYEAVQRGENVTLSIAGAGNVHPEALAAFKAYAQQAVFENDEPFQVCVNCMPIRTVLTDPSYDPCMDERRLDYFMCLNGYPVMMLNGFSGVQNLPAAMGMPGFRYMSWLDADYSLIQTIDPAFCTLKRLQFAFLGSVFLQLSSVPDCLDLLSSLLFISLSQNVLTTFPTSIFRSPSVIYIDAGLSTASTRMPADCRTAVNLQILDLNSGGWQGPMCDFSGLSNLRILDTHANSLSDFQASKVAGLSSLIYFDISSNNFTGPMPSLSASAASLLYFSVRSNRFTGDFPAGHANFKRVTYFDASENELTGSSDLSVFARMDKLLTLNLRKNQLVNHGYVDFRPLDRFGYNPLAGPYNYINSGIGPKLLTMDLSFNRIRGHFPNGIFIWQFNNIPLKTLILSHNEIANFPQDLFIGPQWERLDWSYNALDAEAELPAIVAFPKTLISLDVSNNPNFTSASGLPSWIQLDHSKLFQVSEDILCTGLASNAQPLLKLSFDPVYYQYQGCQCGRGSYGVPPTCPAIPFSAGQNSPRLNPLAPLSLAATNGAVPAQSFSDAWYGSQRYLTGLDSTFDIDLRGVLFDTNTASFIAKSSSTIPGTAEPIVAIEVIVFIDRAVFNQAADTLEISGAALASEQSISGLETGSLPHFMLAGSGLSADSEAILASFTDLRVWRISIIGESGSVRFQSRAARNTHFYALYEPLLFCPSGFKLVKSACVAVLPRYDVSFALRTALIVVAGVLAFVAFLALVYFFSHRNDAILRASSRYFVFFVLVMLVWLSGSASLYAVVPSGDNGDQICDARIWCSCLSLMGVLAVLVAKSFRVSLIFGSKVLMQIKSVSDQYVASLAGMFLATQILMLAVMSGNKMTWADQITYNQQAVWGCQTGNGFDQWLAVQVALFAASMIAGAFVAFKTRTVPSAFNESTHILFSLQILLFFLLILVPLDWALVNTPEASVVIQAGGQIALALFLLAANFIPKLYYIVMGRGNDKTLIFQSASGSKGGGGGNSNISSSYNSSAGQSSASNEGTEMTGASNGSQL